MAERKVPELSLMGFIEGSSNEQAIFVDRLFTGIKDYGFVILKDHPIQESLLQRAYEMSEEFFQLPTEIKLKYAPAGSAGQRGYTPFGKEHAKDAEVMDLKEFWHVGQILPPGHPYERFYPANLWPSEIPEFQSTFTRMFRELEQTGQSLLQALTHPLGVDIHFFDQMTEYGNSILRLLHYPPIPEDADPRCLRAAPHEDINLITILVSATSSGLQLKDRNGEWLDVVSDPGSLVVDAGDMLARITNDVIPSTTHQVVNPAGGKNESRYSMPFFMHPHPEALLSCIDSCKGQGAKYEDITAQDFLMQRLREIGLI